LPNLYASAAAFSRRYANASTLDSDDQTEMLAVLEAASRAVDDECDRRFYAETATVVQHGNGKDAIWIPDLISATTVKLDEDGDGTFETTLTTADYWLERYGHYNVDATPKTLIRLNPSGQRASFVEQHRLLEIVGPWGFTAAVDRMTVTATLADATATAMTTSATGDFEVGNTLLIESEQVYVESGSGTSWVVRRAQNGTTGAAHAAKPIDRFAYVPEIVNATLMQAGRYWKRRETAYANVIQNPLTGAMEMFKGLDPDVSRLIAPFRRKVQV